MSSLLHPSGSVAEAALQPRAQRWLVGFLVLWCGFLFFYGLNAGQLYRTENLRAIIAEGMLRSGDWLVPRLYGEPLFTKPPGMYVAIVLCSLPFGGVTEFSARLPSALAATVTVLLFYRMFRRYVGVRGGLIAAGMLPMSLIYLDKTTAAEIDMLLVAFVIGAVYCFLRLLETKEGLAPGFDPAGSKTRPRAWGELGWWLGVELCLAGGVLTKWTAPAFFYTMAVPLLWWRGRLRLLWSWQHLVAASLAAALCLGWIAAAIFMTGWDIFYATILREAFPRLLPFYDRLYHQHHSYWVEVLRHPVWVLGTGLPSSVIALWSLRRGFFRIWDERGRLLVAALHCWAWPNLLFWTLISDHKPRHSFPLMPAVMGLAALVVLGWCTGKLPLPWPRIAPRKAVCAALALWTVVKVFYVEVVMPGRTAQAQPRDKGLLLAAAVPPASPLYVFKIKDEGIMFYFGRAVLRLASFRELPWPSEPMYCILEVQEWEQLRHERSGQVVERLTDEQGKPIVLVRVYPQDSKTRPGA
jgi:4-amino-4-deoxy-L-arabinose transferase-like glycosyltransferase